MAVETDIAGCKNRIPVITMMCCVGGEDSVVCLSLVDRQIRAASFPIVTLSAGVIGSVIGLQKDGEISGFPSTGPSCESPSAIVASCRYRFISTGRYDSGPLSIPYKVSRENRIIGR